MVQYSPLRPRKCSPSLRVVGAATRFPSGYSGLTLRLRSGRSSSGEERPSQDDRGWVSDTLVDATERCGPMYLGRRTAEGGGPHIYLARRREVYFCARSTGGREVKIRTELGCRDLAAEHAARHPATAEGGRPTFIGASPQTLFPRKSTGGHESNPHPSAALRAGSSRKERD